jgi:Uma2 family endonuclease
MPATFTQESFRTILREHLRQTVDDWDLMPADGNRYELLDGDINMASAPDIAYQIVSTNTAYEIKRYLSENPIGIIVAAPGVIFDRYNGVIPDLVYLSNEKRETMIYGGKIHGAPDLLIEILSPGKANTDRDRVTKRHLYARFGVTEYWIIDARRRNVEIYRLEGRTLNLAATRQEHDALTSPQLPGFNCLVSQFFSLPSVWAVR